MELVDNRDLRDPQKLGQNLKYQSSVVNSGYDKKRPFSWVYDNMGVSAPNYPQDELLSTVTAREYRRELEARAAAGDKYAKSVLETGKPLD